jgi:hypothetical protein
MMAAAAAASSLCLRRTRFPPQPIKSPPPPQAAAAAPPPPPSPPRPAAPGNPPQLLMLHADEGGTTAAAAAAAAPAADCTPLAALHTPRLQPASLPSLCGVMWCCRRPVPAPVLQSTTAPLPTSSSGPRSPSLGLGAAASRCLLPRLSPAPHTRTAAAGRLRRRLESTRARC